MITTARIAIAANVERNFQTFCIRGIISSSHLRMLIPMPSLFARAAPRVEADLAGHALGERYCGAFRARSTRKFLQKIAQTLGVSRSWVSREAAQNQNRTVKSQH